MAYRSLKFPMLPVIVAAVISFAVIDANAAYQDATPIDYSFERYMKGMTDLDYPGGAVKNGANGLALTGENLVKAQAKAAGQNVGVTMKYLGKLGPLAANGLFRIVSASSLIGLAAFAVEACVEKVPGGWLKLSCFPGGVQEGSLSDGWVYTPPGNNGSWASVDIAANKYLKTVVPPTLPFQKTCTLASQNQANTSRLYSCIYSYTQGSNSYSSEFIVQGQVGSCPAGHYLTTNGCTVTPPDNIINETDFVNHVKNRQISAAFAHEVAKSFPVPIEPGSVKINDGQVKVYPQSAPQKVPNSDPVFYLQRLLQMTPAGTPARPMRVDIKTVTEETTTETGTTPEEGETRTGGGSPAEEPPDDLCVKNPEIVACSKLGELTPEDIKNKDVNLSINKETGFGPSSGTCPQPKTLSLMGQNFTFSSQTFCDFAGMIKPLFIAFAWFSAAMVFFGFAKKD